MSDALVLGGKLFVFKWYKAVNIETLYWLIGTCQNASFCSWVQIALKLASQSTLLISLWNSGQSTLEELFPFWSYKLHFRYSKFRDGMYKPNNKYLGLVDLKPWILIALHKIKRHIKSCISIRKLSLIFLVSGVS